MAKILPTIAFTSNANTASTNSGPNSMAIAASITDSLTVDLMEQQLITTSATTTLFGNGSDYATASGGDSDGNANLTPGTVGGYVFLRNNSSTTGDDLYIGIVNSSQEIDPQAPTAPASNYDLQEADHDSLRTMTLKPGEFAWFPWDYLGDLYYKAAAGKTPVLEYWRWDRA